MSAQSDINDRHPNVFAVSNIDDDGNRVSHGHLEVTESQLVLHQKGKDAVRWPLKSLRRYGAEADIFSFESGRKCQTGPGIYAFRCERAEKLLVLLQERVRTNPAASAARSGSADDPENEYNRHLSVVSGQSGSEAAPPMPPAPLVQGRLASVTSTTASVSGLDGADNAGVAASTMPEYANVNCNGGPVALEAADGYLVPNTPVHLNFPNGGGMFNVSGREYENVGLDHNRPSSKATASNSCGVMASPVAPKQPPLLPPKPSASAGLPPSSAAPVHQDQVQLALPKEATSNGDHGDRQINYIAVDFENGSAAASSSLSGPVAPPSPSALAETSRRPSQSGDIRGEYSTIDIDRTKALSTTARQQTQRDSPAVVKKSRHNSTLSELTAKTILGVKRNSIID